MGYFSWLTSDTKRSISNSDSRRKTFTVHMITEDGQIFTEKNYEGYGEFGGKDIYVLVAEMNGFKGATDDETRMLFFDKIWRRGVVKGDKRYYYKEDFPNYGVVIPAEGVDANTLVSERGWKYFGDSGEFVDFVAGGFKMPKLVEHLPAKETWLREWIQLPYPECCEDQGFFYNK